MSVTIMVLHDETEIELDTREFDTLPRMDDLMRLSQGEAFPRPRILEQALCRVATVVHDVIVAYKRPAHAYVQVEPLTEADWQILRQLYPETAGEER